MLYFTFGEHPSIVSMEIPHSRRVQFILHQIVGRRSLFGCGSQSFPKFQREPAGNFFLKFSERFNADFQKA